MQLHYDVFYINMYIFGAGLLPYLSVGAELCKTENLKNL